MKIEILDEVLFQSETSFNVIFRKDGKLLALARGERRGDGLIFTMARMYKDSKVEDLKQSIAEFKSRVFDTVVATVEIDTLTLNASCGFLQVNKRLF